ncbi:DUF349 domain-containing protein [Neoactinobaculum massilliense]|uniref:DUF349 domain-containing protein n=1 Tax=Neoactinobaculum massilliense TaxID=2364794 RepID=UPI001F151405|nr:DUF349 domain-containing protein [Neoactinobaculum massilliense]
MSESQPASTPVTPGQPEEATQVPAAQASVQPGENAAAMATEAPGAPAPTTPVVFTPEEAAAAAFGRVADDGSVYVREAEGERKVGEFAASGSTQDALLIFVRRYTELATQVALLEQRVETIAPEEAGKSLKSLRKDLEAPDAVGDLAALRNRLETLSTRIEQRRAEVAEERKAAKAAALAARMAVVERAEALAAQDPAQTHWKNTRAELSSLFEEWQRQQKSGVRIDRPTEQKLWKRFSQARSAFDRNRRKHFAQLDTERQAVVARKEALIKEAEALATSTDWGTTSAQYRELMDEWRHAGRARHREDDALWDRFRAAQQPFFDARAAHFAQQDEARGDNLSRKLALLKDAEKVLEISDPEQARNALRKVEDKWDEIGEVPRKDEARTEGRMREIEDQIRRAEAEQWRRTDPEKQARSNGMAAQLEALIEELDGEIAAAKAKGDDKQVAELEESRRARVAWLEQVNSAL